MLVLTEFRQSSFRMLKTMPLKRQVHNPFINQAPGPIPLGDKQQRKEMEQLIKEEEKRTLQREIHKDAEKEPLPGFEGGKNPVTGEVNGPKGPEPTRYGDWERKGRVYDF